MPVPKHITIKNTHPTDILEIRSIFTETDTLDVKEASKNIWIEPGQKKIIKVMIIPEMLGR